MRTRLLPALIGFVLGATLIGGISVAATKSSGALKACKTSSGVLTLATKHGACARGQKKVSLNITGPRGLTGPQGPGALSTVATEAKAGTPFTVPGTGLTISTSCDSSVASFTISGKVGYTAGGTVYVLTNPDASATYVYPGISPAGIPQGGVDFGANPSASVQQSQFVVNAGTSGSGHINATLLVAVGSTAFTVTFVESASVLGPAPCTAFAEATPA